MSNTKIPNRIAAKTGQSLEQLMTKFAGNKSAVIRHLAAQSGSEFAHARIADFMDIKYQFVRNVLNNPLKKAEPVEAVEETKSEVKVLTGQAAKDKLAGRPKA